MENTKEKVFSSLIWRIAERFGANGITFIVEIVLARLLDPKVYGTLALVTVFTTILQVFVDSGLGNALIQKKDADTIDFSSVFVFNIIVCLILYFGMFVSAPLISDFYKMPELVNVIRVMSLVIVISGVKNVQQAYVARNLMFKKFFFSTLGGTIGAAIVGITMAYSGCGIWALVAQNLVNQFLGTTILWVTVPWRPEKVFSWSRLKGLISFGWKLLVASLLDVITINLRALIIGKKYSAENLAFYNKGQQFPQLVNSCINSSIDSILFPVLSAAQDDSSSVKAMTRRAIKTSCYIIAPCMIGLTACADSLVMTLLTEKWMPCVPYLRVFCLVFALYPIHTANLNAIKAMGRSDNYLLLEIIKKIIDFTVLFAVMNLGVSIIAYSMIPVNIVCMMVNARPNKTLINYGFCEQLKDIVPELACSVIMGILVYCISLIKLNCTLLLIIQIIAGIAIYYLITRILKLESYYYLMSIINDFTGKMRKKENAN